MKFIFVVMRLLKNTMFTIVLLITLTISTAGLVLKTLSIKAQMTVATAHVAKSAVNNRKEIAAAVVRVKVEARLRRIVEALPFVGVAAVVAFEKRDYESWQIDNPNRTLACYSCETATIGAEILDEVLAELPEKIRPSKDNVLSLLPSFE